MTAPAVRSGRIVIEPFDHRVGQHRQPPGLHRGGQRARLRREIGAVRAAARADRAVLARGAALVGLGLGEVGGAADRQAASGPFRENRFTRMPFDHIERHRRLELAIRQLRQTFGRARNTDELFHLVIPRRHVGIADRPVGAVAVAAVGAEVVVRPAVGLPSPGQRAAAKLVRAEPGELAPIGGRVWVLCVVDEVTLRELGEVPVERLHRVFAFVERGIALPAERQVPRRLGLGCVVLLVPDRAAALDHQDLEPGFGQFLGRPATGDARADHDRVELHGFARHQPQTFNQNPPRSSRSKKRGFQGLPARRNRSGRAPVRSAIPSRRRFRRCNSRSGSAP